MSFNIFDIFEYKKWNKALFLTYMVSLTFFETIILRRLRNVGCQDIWIVADADGYQMSLSERKSIRVGQEYRIVPVALKNGVFHPKCIYLSSDEGDILLVGSGNLTFGGYGRNLEVLEILHPIKNPIAFIDFADFLDSLLTHKTLMISNTKWITDFSNLSRISVNEDKKHENEETRIISNVKNTISNQIQTFCNNIGKPKRIISLSPFYSNNANSLKDLANKASIKHLSIGLLPKNKE